MSKQDNDSPFTIASDGPVQVVNLDADVDEYGPYSEFSCKLGNELVIPIRVYWRKGATHAEVHVLMENVRDFQYIRLNRVEADPARAIVRMDI